MVRKTENLIIENAEIIFPNFSGKESKYNRAGDRNFNVVFTDEELVNKLREDGWNISIIKPREGDDTVRYKMKVNVRFDKDNPRRNPRVVMHTRKNETLLDADSVGSLDYADIKSIDMEIRPYEYDSNGKRGISAYLKTMHVTIDEDVFADKYAKNEYPEE